MTNAERNRSIALGMLIELYIPTANDFELRDASRDEIAANIDKLAALGRTERWQAAITRECTDGQYRADILASGETSWASNALTFDTRENALAYARDLAGRWTLVSKWRAVPVATPAREAYVPGSEDGGW